MYSMHGDSGSEKVDLGGRRARKKHTSPKHRIGVLPPIIDSITRNLSLELGELRALER